jgi:c-di-GMP-binding flagellar brake protein YcgR
MKVIDMITDERRSYVRGDFSFKVEYKAITQEEYEDLLKFDGKIFPSDGKELIIDDIHMNKNPDSKVDAPLINFLFQMDEKLNQIINLLTKSENEKSVFRQGVGQDINGSGMELIIDQQVEPEYIINTKFFLSKFPIVFIDAFGEIVRTTKVDEKKYHLGIKFINLGENEREKIISYVFQRKRETIRKKKR